MVEHLRQDLPPVDLNGTPPELRGRECHELFVQEWWYQGECVDPMQGLFGRFGSEPWFRLYFDSGFVFWRLADVPKAYRAEELDGEARLLDIAEDRSLRGTSIVSLQMSRVPNASEVAFAFSDDRVLRVTGWFDDRNEWILEPKAHGTDT